MFDIYFFIQKWNALTIWPKVLYWKAAMSFLYNKCGHEKKWDNFCKESNGKHWRHVYLFLLKYANYMYMKVSSNAHHCINSIFPVFKIFFVLKNNCSVFCDIKYFCSP